MACRFLGAKALPESMMISSLLITSLWTNFGEFWSKYERFCARKCISRYILQIFTYIVQSSCWRLFFVSPTFQSSWFKRSEVRFCEQKYLPGWMTCCPTICLFEAVLSLQWRHNGHDSVSNHQSHDCLLNRLFRRRSKNTSKLRVTGLCAGNSLGTGEFPAQMASNAENVFIWWRHHVCWIFCMIDKDSAETERWTLKIDRVMTSIDCTIPCTLLDKSL